MTWRLVPLAQDGAQSGPSVFVTTPEQLAAWLRDFEAFDTPYRLEVYGA